MTTATTTQSECLEGQPVSAERLAGWITAFHRDGYVFIDDVLSAQRCRALRDDIDEALGPTPSKPTECQVRMFERSAANLALFDLDPVVSLAEALIGEDDRYGTDGCHVVHNNNFRTSAGGGWSNWHQDDSSHFKVTHGEPPTNIHLPCLLLTANYYLTDQPDVSYGCGQAIPGSHKFGAAPPAELSGTRFEERVVTCAGRTGGVMVFNNQVWHRAAPNRSARTRYVAQVSYGRKSIGHFFAPFMNYQMPEHVYRDANPRLLRLLGFLPGGAYG